MAAIIKKNGYKSTDLSLLTNNLFNNIEYDYYNDLLHILCNAYIDKKRNQYVVDEISTIDQQIKKRKVFDKEAYVSYLINDVDFDQLIELIKTKVDLNLYPLIKDDLENNQGNLLNKCLLFRKDPHNYKFDSNDERKIIQSSLRTVNQVLNKLFEINALGFNPAITYDIDTKEEINPASNIDLLNILLRINVKEFAIQCKNNKDDLTSLLTFFNTFGLLGYGTSFNDAFYSVGVKFDYSTLASLISNFSTINQEIEMENRNGEHKTSLINLISKANDKDIDTMKYNILFGKENYHLIISNPVPNSSKIGEMFRIEQAVEEVKKMYQRKYVTIPPIKKDYDVNGKKISVNAGNITNMINLTYGERTGSCMRIGGIGQALFDLCNENVNGFHIRFTDPTTLELISRVSCYRNGNTIFLNELRSSLSEKYTDEEIAASCKMVVKDIIEHSKYSKYPIEYAVISDDYAMINHKDEKVDTGIKQSIEGFDNAYTNIKQEAIILSDNEKELKDKPIVLNPQKAPNYFLLRDEVTVTTKEFALKKVLQVKIINELLNGNTIDNIDLQAMGESLDIESCISGEDWYIYVDSNGNIHEFMMDKSLQDEVAILEKEESKQKFLDYFEIKNNNKKLQ